MKDNKNKIYIFSILAIAFFGNNINASGFNKDLFPIKQDLIDPSILDFSTMEFSDIYGINDIMYAADIDSDISNIADNYTFTFKFRFEVNPNSDKLLVSPILTDGDLDNVILTIQLYNDEQMDNGYILIDSISNSSENIVYNRNITFSTPYRPNGFDFNLIHGRGEFSDTISKSYSISTSSYHPDKQQTYDGSYLRVNNFSNIEYLTRHHFNTFQVDINHSTSCEYFLGNETDDATSTIQYTSNINTKNLDEQALNFTLHIKPTHVMRNNIFSSSLGGEKIITNTSSLLTHPNQIHQIINNYTFANGYYDENSLIRVPYDEFWFENDIEFDFLNYIPTKIELKIRLYDENDNDNVTEPIEDAKISGFFMNQVIIISSCSIFLYMKIKRKNLE